MDQLLARRVKLRISQRSLHRKSKVSRRTLNEIESGRRAARASTLVKLADELGVDAAVLGEHSGLPGRVLRAAARAMNGQELRPRDLARMPRDFREALTSLLAAQQELMRCVSETGPLPTLMSLAQHLAHTRSRCTQMQDAFMRAALALDKLHSLQRRFPGGAEGSREDLLIQLRRSRALSQEDLASCSGVSKSTIGRIERGEPMSLKASTKLGAYFGIDPGRLRSQANLALIVKRVLRVVNKGLAPSPSDMRFLPDDIRTTVQAVCDAEDEHREASERLAVVISIFERCGNNCGEQLAALSKVNEAIMREQGVALALGEARFPLIGVAFRFL